jgi:histidine triad (HIT) family protein
VSSIFTKILQGEIPGHFVWRDPHCFSIMTIQPIREGHLLVIPNDEINHWDEVPADTAAHLMLTAQKIASAMKLVIPCRRIGVSVIGLEVPHAHIHLIPIDSMEDMSFSRAHPVAQEQLAAMALAIRQVLIKQGCQQADLG